jgi:selenocysteine lyase/cysteine desulfurase
MYDLETLRQTQFPVSTEALYFNHASISPLPVVARDKMAWSVGELASHPTRHFMRDGLPLFGAFKQELAELIHAESPDDIVPIYSTSSGLNPIAQALPLQVGENIVFCEQEFPTNAYPWMSRQRDGAEIRLVPHSDGGLTLDKLAPYVDAKTRLVAVSAVQFFSGHRTDLQAIGDFCHARGVWFSVDAIQAVGHMPIDVQAMHIDILAAGGQKSLMAPPGVGFLYVRREVADQMTPRTIGCDATRDWEFWLDYDLTPLAGAERFNGGTPNVVGMFGLLESVRLLRSLGLAHIDAHTSALSAEAIGRLRALGYEVITSLEEHGPIVTFCASRPEHTEALMKFLLERGVSLAKHLSPQAKPHLRISFHCYNTRQELDRLFALMQEFQP